MATLVDRLPPSRPLSEISENEDRRRRSARISSYSSSVSLKGGDKLSRPSSEVRDDPKRVSLPVHTITLNLADYTTSSPALSNPASPRAASPVRKAPPQVHVDELETLNDSAIVDLNEEDDSLSPLLMATRAALRPVQPPQAPSAEPTPSPPSSSSFDSPRSSVDLKPLPKAKPRWLKRASMTPVLRQRSRSPSESSIQLPEPVSPHFSTATPPALPPRKFPAGPMDTPVAGPSRPPQHPASHHSASLGGVGRRWSRSGGGSGVGGGVSRSSSSTSIMSTASAAHQRLPSSAQRVLGHAGNAVSKTWMRARGVGSSMSISGMATVRGVEPEPVSPGLTRKLSRDIEMPSAEADMFTDNVVKRRPRNGLRGRVFGRELSVAGRQWGVYDAAEERPMEGEYDRRRRQCLPAVAIRCVEYLELWGPKEEGIFRISGRTSHLVRLRKEFDAGADLDLTLCDPSDVDPHAIAGTFKAYLRDLPEPMIPASMEARVEQFTKGQEDVTELVDILSQLPSANWFLLADVIKLIDLIPRFIDVNRMSHNALMLSLGPTLRMTGEHVALFVRHRDKLFANPPSVSPRELVDFGDEEIAPLSPMYDDTPLPGVSPSVSSGSIASLHKRPAPRVSKRPSFGNLLGSRAAMRKSQSEQTLSVSPVPPRIDLPEANIPLPSFGDGDPDENDENEVERAASPVRASDRTDDSHYANGTVAERARAYSTPIADRFQRSRETLASEPSGSRSAESTAALSIASTSSLSSSIGSELVPPPNPMSKIRRSPPIFFSSSSHEPVSGVKRKEDGARRDEGGEAREARDSPKRLSSGPGPSDDEAMQE